MWRLRWGGAAPACDAGEEGWGDTPANQRPYKSPECTAFQHTQMDMVRIATVEPSSQSMIGEMVGWLHGDTHVQAQPINHMRADNTQLVLVVRATRGNDILWNPVSVGHFCGASEGTIRVRWMIAADHLCWPRQNPKFNSGSYTCCRSTPTARVVGTHTRARVRTGCING